MVMVFCYQHLLWKKRKKVKKYPISRIYQCRPTSMGGWRECFHVNKNIFGRFYFYERCMNFAKDLFINKLLSSLSKDATLMNFPYSDIAQNMSFNPPPFFLMGTVWIVTIIWQFFSAAAASLLCFRQDNRSAGGET